jgi:hypothetical protein
VSVSGSNGRLFEVALMMIMTFASRCPYREQYPAVFMMKSAKNRSCRDLPKPLSRTTERRVLAESEVRPGVIIKGGVGRKDPAQMGLAKDDDMIETFAADRANQSLRMPILPGRPCGCWMVPDTHASKTLRDRMTISGVSVSNEMIRYIVPRKGISNLISVI